MKKKERMAKLHMRVHLLIGQLQVREYHFGGVLSALQLHVGLVSVSSFLYFMLCGMKSSQLSFLVSAFPLLVSPLL